MQSAALVWAFNCRLKSMSEICKVGGTELLGLVMKILGVSTLPVIVNGDW